MSIDRETYLSTRHAKNGNTDKHQYVTDVLLSISIA